MTLEELEALVRRLREERPDAWEQLPDLALYMDQLISYMPRQLIRFGEGDVLTSAMVNNYIKDGLLPRAEGKRYGRSHLAYLTAICALKQVMSVKEMSVLLGSPSAQKEPEALYAYFLGKLDEALSEVADDLDGAAGATSGDLTSLALTLALGSYAHKLACQRVLDLLREKNPQEFDHESKKKK